MACATGILPIVEVLLAAGANMDIADMVSQNENEKWRMKNENWKMKYEIWKMKNDTWYMNHP